MPQPSKPVLPARVREAQRAEAIAAQENLRACAAVAQALGIAGWTDVEVGMSGPFVSIRGVDVTGAHHSAAVAPDAAVDEARRLIAVGVPRVRKAQPEAFPTPPAEIVASAEPLPDQLAAMVPDGIDAQRQKTWLRDRWQELTHKLQSPRVFGPMSPAETREHEQLERYRGLFT